MTGQLAQSARKRALPYMGKAFLRVVFAVFVCSKALNVLAIEPAELRSFAAQKLRNGEVHASVPTVAVTEYSVSLCFTGSSESFNAGRDSALGMMMYQQLRTSAMRTTKTKFTMARAVWMADEADKIIAKMVRDYNTPSLSESDLQDRFRGYSGNIFQIYLQGAQDYAKAVHKRFDHGACGTTYRAIEIHCTPQGAVVSYMPSLHHDLYNFEVFQKGRKNVRKPTWIAVPEDSAPEFYVGGTYYFTARWGDVLLEPTLYTIPKNVGALVVKPTGIQKKQ